MKFILVNPPTLYWVKSVNQYGKASYLDLVLKYLGGIQNARHFPIEHTGLGSIKSYCKSKGIDVAVVNGLLMQHRTEQETFDAVIREIGDDSPILVGFTGPNLVFEENLEIIRRLKKKFPNVKTVLGHDFASLNSKLILEKYSEIDYIIVGDGEIAFHKLCTQLEQSQFGLEDIPGLVFRREKGIHANPPQVVDVNALPLADRSDVLRVINHGYGVSVSSSRGCPYRCTFCTTGQTAALVSQKDSHRIRNIDSVLLEIETLVREFGAKYFVITDDLFLTRHPDSIERARKLAQGIIEKKLNISWMIDCRVDSIDLELFRLMREAGLTKIFVGVETGSKAQRKKYAKSFPEKYDPETVLTEVEKLGITVIPGILTFHPESESKELRETLRLIEKLGTHNNYHFVNRVKPYPGTTLYSQYKENGWLTTEWPVADFKFKNPQLEIFFSDMLNFCTDPQNTYLDCQVHFRELINQLEKNGG